MLFLPTSFLEGLYAPDSRCRFIETITVCVPTPETEHAAGQPFRAQEACGVYGRYECPEDHIDEGLILDPNPLRDFGPTPVQSLIDPLLIILAEFLKKRRTRMFL